MNMDVKVLVDDVLRTLFAHAYISQRDEVRFPVCQLLKTLGLVKIEGATDSKCPETIELRCCHTEKLKNMLRNVSRMEPNNSDDNNDNNNDNDNNDNDNDIKPYMKRI